MISFTILTLIYDIDKAFYESIKKLSASDFGFPDTTSKIFINDHLTRHNKLLLSRAKKLASDNNYNYTWVQNCRILVRKNNTSPILRINTESDLSKIK